MFWMTRSWTRDDFLNTLAARADFGFGWRGVDAAARGFFGRPAGELTLPAGRDDRVAPRCAGGRSVVRPEGAAARRDLTLRQMHANGAIDEASLQEALGRPLELGLPPADHKPCRD